MLTQFDGADSTAGKRHKWHSGSPSCRIWKRNVRRQIPRKLVILVICGPQEYIAISADRLKPLEYAFSEDRKLFSAWSATPFRPFSIQAAFKTVRPHQTICWPCLIDGAACPFTAFAALAGRDARSSCAEALRAAGAWGPFALCWQRGPPLRPLQNRPTFRLSSAACFFHACLSAARWSIALLARWPSPQRRGGFEAQALRAGAEPGLCRACWHSSARPKPA